MVSTVNKIRYTNFDFKATFYFICQVIKQLYFLNFLFSHYRINPTDRLLLTCICLYFDIDISSFCLHYVQLLRKLLSPYSQHSLLLEELACACRAYSLYNLFNFGSSLLYFRAFSGTSSTDS